MTDLSSNCSSTSPSAADVIKLNNRLVWAASSSFFSPSALPCRLDGRGPKLTEVDICQGETGWLLGWDDGFDDASLRQVRVNGELKVIERLSLAELNASRPEDAPKVVVYELLDEARRSDQEVGDLVETKRHNLRGNRHLAPAELSPLQLPLKLGLDHAIGQVIPNRGVDRQTTDLQDAPGAVIFDRGHPGDRLNLLFWQSDGDVAQRDTIDAIKLQFTDVEVQVIESGGLALAKVARRLPGRSRRQTAP